MGDIADMHIAAWEAGLDPNEMDGADWADFYNGLDIIVEAPTGDDIASDFRLLTVPDIASAALHGENFSETLRRLWPKLTEGQARGFEAFLEVVNGFPEDG